MNKIPNPYKLKRVRRPVLSKQELTSSKIRITTYLDEDLLDALRKIALESGSKYQTVLNQILRKSLLGEKHGVLNRLERLERAVWRYS